MCCRANQVVGPGDDVELLKEEVMSDMADIFSSVDKGGTGFQQLNIHQPPCLYKAVSCTVLQNKCKIFMCQLAC